MKILVFDLETTGLERSSRITEFAGCMYDDSGMHIKSEAEITNPEISIPNNITQITGITNKMAKAGKSWPSYARDVIMPLLEEADVYAGHNIISFDLPILRYNLKRVGLSLPDRLKIDTLQVARRFLTIKKKSLGYVCGFYGISLDGAHRALNDAKANADMMFKMSEDLEIPISDMAHGRAVTLGKYHQGKDPFEALIGGLSVNFYRHE